MALFELEDASHVVPFRQRRGGADLYEREIEELLWQNFEELTGESVFPIAKQANVAGGRADIVALDHDARVVVVEIKRDVDRGQLAQCLEYAGWARTTNLDELSGMYHRGIPAFFSDWQDFMESTTPVRIRRSPRLVLVARDFHGRTGSAFEFLIEHGLPVKLIRVSLYEDQQGRKLATSRANTSPSSRPKAPRRGARHTEALDPTKINGRRVRLSDLLEAGLVQPEQRLVWERPRLDQSYRATVTDAGAIRLEDGREFPSPSRAAMEAAQIPAYDGWYAWRLGEGGESLHELRVRMVSRAEDNVEAASGVESSSSYDT